jgi:hypothetical protein
MIEFRAAHHGRKNNRKANQVRAWKKFLGPHFCELQVVSLDAAVHGTLATSHNILHFRA